MLKDNYGLTFGQIGFLTFTFQVTASLLQPLIGFFTDKHAAAVLVVDGHGIFSRRACCCLSRADSYPLLLAAAALVGMGSAVLHPESSRVARMAAGNRPGLAQSLFQMGGNLGSSIGPLFAAVVVSALRAGQRRLVRICGRRRDGLCCSASAVGTPRTAWRACAPTRRAAREQALSRGRVIVRARDPRRADALEVRLHARASRATTRSI